MPTLSAHLSRIRNLPAVEPIPFTPRADAFDDPEWLFEPKYDGFRGLLYSASGQCEIRLQPGLRFDHLDALRERVAGVLGVREVILDGEVVALDRRGKPILRDLLRGQGYLAFAASDLLWLEGQDIRSLPLKVRKALLAGLLPEDTGPLYKILTMEEYGRALYSAIKKMDLEGIVGKRKSDPYSPGSTWYQIRNPGHSRSEGERESRGQGERARETRVLA
jgi:bifunctional non-homologous end joining protein LigD